MAHSYSSPNLDYIVEVRRINLGCTDSRARAVPARLNHLGLGLSLPVGPGLPSFLIGLVSFSEEALDGNDPLSG